MIGYSNAELFVLYKKFKEGDERAFEVLYERLSGGLFNYCVRLLSDWHYAEDVLVQTFTKLANSNLDERGNLKAWLYRVATNACYSFFRKKKTESKCFEQQLQTVISNPGHDFVAELRVQKFLNLLPEYQRIVVVLKFYEQMTYGDIADVLCCPVGTVKSRMHSGLEKLRSLIKERE
ncbi:MAG: RNA polymerase sigma factor [candidate division WOR-3 bacterium]|nr:MAG: RNA polymerase sigma factor [candidate division WOR-3 bacterium]